MSDEVFTVVFFLVFFVVGALGVVYVTRSVRLTLVRKGAHVEGQLVTKLLGIFVVGEKSFLNVERAEIEYRQDPDPNDGGLYHRLALVADGDTHPLSLVYTNGIAPKGVVARINRYIENGPLGRPQAFGIGIEPTRFVAGLVVAVVFWIGAIGLLVIGWGYWHRYFTTGRADEPAPAEFPIGAYFPGFCAFGTVETQRQPPAYQLLGRTSLFMQRAVRYVEEAKWPGGWHRIDRVVKSDSVMTEFGNGAKTVTYAFVDEKENGTTCFVAWDR